MIKGDSASAAKPLGHWAIKGGDATASDGLKTLFDGPRPCAGAPPACVNKANQSWSPMRKFGGTDTTLRAGLTASVAVATLLALFTPASTAGTKDD